MGQPDKLSALFQEQTALIGASPSYDLTSIQGKLAGIGQEDGVESSSGTSDPSTAAVGQARPVRLVSCHLIIAGFAVVGVFRLTKNGNSLAADRR